MVNSDPPHEETIDLDDETSISALIAQGWRDFAEGPQGNTHALHDYKLPAIVRGYLAINQGNATETMAIREAGFMPTLFALFEGEPVRVTLVSSMGDVGINRQLDEEYGYSLRCSIYDLTDFSLTVPCRKPNQQPPPPMPPRATLEGDYKPPKEPRKMPPPKLTRRERKRRDALIARSSYPPA